MEKKYTSGINRWEKNDIYSINCTLIIIKYSNATMK